MTKSNDRGASRSGSHRACRRCGRSIRFVKSSVTGALIPLDCDSAGSIFVIEGDGENATCRPAGDRVQAVSHFASCPNADDFRKPRAGAARAASSTGRLPTREQFRAIMFEAARLACPMCLGDGAHDRKAIRHDALGMWQHREVRGVDTLPAAHCVASAIHERLRQVEEGGAR